MTHKERKARRKEIAEWVKNSDSETPRKDAVDHFKCTAEFVRRACAEYGVLIRDSRRGTAPEHTFSIIGDLCNTDDTFSTIARRYNLTKQRIQQIASRCEGVNIPIRRRKPGPRQPGEANEGASSL